MSEQAPIAYCPECDTPIYHEWEWELHKHPCTYDLESKLHPEQCSCNECADICCAIETLKKGKT